MSSRRPLELLEIPTPCPANWDEMSGSARGRFCQHCQKTVHDLSAMPRDQAERLVCQTAGSLCVRVTRLSDGRLQTLDYQPAVPQRRSSWPIWSVVALAGGLMAGVVNAALFGSRVFPTSTRVMGSIALPATPPTVPYAPNPQSSCPSDLVDNDGFDLSATPSLGGPTRPLNQ